MDRLTLWLKELKRYKDLKEQGLMIVLPCKVGTKVYGIYMACPSDFKPGYCIDHDGSCENCHHRVPVILKRTFSIQDIPNFSKTVFATREAAEETLKEMGKNEI